MSIGRHAHPQARPETAPAPSPTGIDYLGLLADRREAEITAASRPITYSQLSLPPGEIQLGGTGGQRATTDEPSDDNTSSDDNKENHS